MSEEARTGAADPPAQDVAASPVRLVRRLASRKAAAMLARNTVISCLVFALNLLLLWLLVEWLGWDELPAAGLAFVAANSLQYGFGRTWVFRGTERGLAAGYVYFLVNLGIGLVITMLLYAALLEWTSIHYLAARVIVSVFAGLTVFMLNATLNFRRL
jgi:putative flippase GtrA